MSASISQPLSARVEPISAALQALFPATESPGAGLLYAQSVAAYLRPFAELPYPGACAAQDVIDDLKQIWSKKGFLPPDQLTVALLERRAPDLNKAAVEVLRQHIHEQCEDRDPLSGFYRKQHAPLLIGLAHLFGVLTGQPVSMVLKDVSNMGETNNHFRRLLAIRSGQSIAQTSREQGEAATDSLVRGVIHKIHDRLAGQVGRDKVVGARLGGDEFVTLVFGRPPKEVARLCAKAMVGVERFLALCGVHDHPHGKYPADWFLRGLGIGMDVQSLDRDTCPGKVFRDAEKGIVQHKQFVGLDRRGPLFFVFPKPRDLSDGEDPNIARLDAAAGLAGKAARRSRILRDFKEKAGVIYPYQHPPTDRQGGNYYEIPREVAERLLDVFEKRAGSSSTSASQMGGSSGLTEEKYTLFDPPRGRQMARFLRALARRYLPREAYEETKKVLTGIIGSFYPDDPATGLVAGHIMPAVFGWFAEDAGKLNGGGKLSYCLAASMENLAGINKTLTSDNANLVLRHFAQNIVLGSFEAHGFSRQDLVAGHLGGGHVVAAIKPFTVRGMERAAVSAERLKEVSREIRDRMEKFRGTHIAEFIRENGGLVPGELPSGMAFGEIPDRRRPEAPGVRVTTFFMPLRPERHNHRISGGANLKRLLKITEWMINCGRRKRLRAFLDEKEAGVRRTLTLRRPGCKPLDILLAPLQP